MFLSLVSCGGWMRNRHVNRPSWIALCISEWFDTAHLQWTFPLGSLMDVNQSINQSISNSSCLPSFYLCSFYLLFTRNILQMYKYIKNDLKAHHSICCSLFNLCNKNVKQNSFKKCIINMLLLLLFWWI